MLPRLVVLWNVMLATCHILELRTAGSNAPTHLREHECRPLPHLNVIWYGARFFIARRSIGMS